MTAPAPPHVPDDENFDLEQFLPFMLNQAAEATSRAFQPNYRDGFGLTRTQWRVLAITGRQGRITARDIGRIAHEEKSKISRAVTALEAEGLIERHSSQTDRRAEELALTPRGEEVRNAVGAHGRDFETTLRATLGSEDEEQLRTLLTRLRKSFSATL